MYLGSGIKYPNQEGKIYTYKLFAERLYVLLRVGHLGVMMPILCLLRLGSRAARTAAEDMPHSYLYAFSNDRFFFQALIIASSSHARFQKWHSATAFGRLPLQSRCASADELHLFLQS